MVENWHIKTWHIFRKGIKKQKFAIIKTAENIRS